jgi:hypothetical protein
MQLEEQIESANKKIKGLIKEDEEANLGGLDCPPLSLAL